LTMTMRRITVSTLFPYTTLFRSRTGRSAEAQPRLEPDGDERLNHVRAETIERLLARGNKVLGGHIHRITCVAKILVVELDAIVEQARRPFLDEADTCGCELIRAAETDAMARERGQLLVACHEVLLVATLEQIAVEIRAIL